MAAGERTGGLDFPCQQQQQVSCPPAQRCRPKTTPGTAARSSASCRGLRRFREHDVARGTCSSGGVCAPRSRLLAAARLRGPALTHQQPTRRNMASINQRNGTDQVVWPRACEAIHLATQKVADEGQLERPLPPRKPGQLGIQGRHDDNQAERD